MALPELLIGLGIALLCLAAVCCLFVFQARSNAALANYVDLDIKNRTALDRITRDIRQANRLLRYTTTNMVFETVNATTGATGSLAYVYSTKNGTLIRTNTGEGNITLLKDIKPNTMSFSFFQRNPVGGTVNQYPTTNASLCKVVQMSWICTKTIFGKTNNSESIQSAKVVIRKE